MKRRSLSYWVLYGFLTLVLVNTTTVAMANTTVDEAQLFSETDSIVEESAYVKETVDDELKEKRIGLSGEIKSDMSSWQYDQKYDWLGTGDKSKNSETVIITDFLIDIRLEDGVKSFIDLELIYIPDKLKDEEFDINIKELFIDNNWQNKVYFRNGKQVLKWGRCYFWNPTDLINIDKKDFFDLDKRREGVYGTKIHIPSGATRNTYFFIGMDDEDGTDEQSFASKYEFLVGKTEMAFSAWYKKDYEPVFGFDFSSRIGSVDVRGEISLSDGDNFYKMNEKTFVLEKEADWIPRVSLGFTKFFDHGDIKDRFRLTGEIYYNGNGYTDNIFEIIDTLAPAAKTTFIEQVYQPYSNSKYYVGVFTTVKKFLVSDLNLSVNAIMNLVDNSVSISSGLNYRPLLKDYEIELKLNSNIGSDYSEATFSGNPYHIYLGTTYWF
ncbi:MAG TPA: hypothetical protein PLZ08_09580 [Bacillota bacterium]|jgi:hypothetical protein|nr:hypothetical protein [Bacillota bacterium]HOL09731.1 hypothetical protein [Bacillota bacterium]HPO98188.1 hypothetical protein [Bacillota bacterium]